MSNIQHIIVPILKQYGVQKAALFGSQARGDDDRISDVDLIIDVNDLPQLKKEIMES